MKNAEFRKLLEARVIEAVTGPMTVPQFKLLLEKLELVRKLDKS